VPVEVVRPDYSCGEPPAATLLDISQNGALLLCETAIPAGEWIVIRPDRKGSGFGAEVTAVVDRNVTPNERQAKLVCRFPQPLDYSMLRLFT
jgi:hypothetical protein